MYWWFTWTIEIEAGPLQIQMGPFATKTGATACLNRMMTVGQQIAATGQQPRGYQFSPVVKR